MVYDISRKFILDGVIKIELTKIECQIFELLLKYDGEPLTANEISNVLCDEYYVSGVNSCITSDSSIRAHISRLNKKLNGIIKVRYRHGYYIEDEIKIIGR